MNLLRKEHKRRNLNVNVSGSEEEKRGDKKAIPKKFGTCSKEGHDKKENEFYDYVNHEAFCSVCAIEK